MATCKSCGKQIFWAKTVGGKMMPIDAEADEKGQLVVDNGVARFVSDAPTSRHRARHNSHFVTCPNADKHRKIKG